MQTAQFYSVHGCALVCVHQVVGCLISSTVLKSEGLKIASFLVDSVLQPGDFKYNRRGEQRILCTVQGGSRGFLISVSWRPLLVHPEIASMACSLTMH